ncbi:hypothetical protein [Cupriavidus oxalaticus]|uniref:hypothetical protein n=1 Tax=Cupriavidus oxalaticus TaxID=96344 RepID=UPI003211D88E
MATLMGTLMAEIMDGRADLNPWKDFDWPAIPGHFGNHGFCPWWAHGIASRTGCNEFSCSSAFANGRRLFFADVRTDMTIEIMEIK